MSLFLLKLTKERQERIAPTSFSSGLVEIIPSGEECRAFFHGQLFYLELAGVAQKIWPHIQKESHVFYISRVKVNQKRGILTIKDGSEVSRVAPWHSEEVTLFEKLVTVHDLWRMENGVRTHWITEHEKQELGGNRYYVHCKIGAVSSNYAHNFQRLCGGCRQKKPDWWLSLLCLWFCGRPVCVVQDYVSDLEEGLRPHIKATICREEAEKLVGMTTGELDELHSSGLSEEKYESLVQKEIVLRLKGVIPSTEPSPYQHSLDFLVDKIFL